VNGRLADRAISTERAVDALDFLLDDLRSDLSAGNADMLIQYAIARYERGEVEGARMTLMHHMDLTAVYRVEAILHT
jgi:hypothetical protein